MEKMRNIFFWILAALTITYSLINSYYAFTERLNKGLILMLALSWLLVLNYLLGIADGKNKVFDIPFNKLNIGQYEACFSFEQNYLTQANLNRKKIVQNNNHQCHGENQRVFFVLSNIGDEYIVRFKEETPNQRPVEADSENNKETPIIKQRQIRIPKKYVLLAEKQEIELIKKEEKDEVAETES